MLMGWTSDPLQIPDQNRQEISLSNQSPIGTLVGPVHAFDLELLQNPRLLQLLRRLHRPRFSDDPAISNDVDDKVGRHYQPRLRLDIVGMADA